MGERADFIVEIGTEELPPNALKHLATAFHDSLLSLVTEEDLVDEESESTFYCSPRRLAVRICGLIQQQPDQEFHRKGPPLAAAYKEGKPTKAAEGFARSCGVDLADLDTEDSGKGIYLVYRGTQKGKPAAELLPALVERSLAQLPIPRRMRWGDSSLEFVRPVHWVLMRLGKQVIDATIMGVRTGGTTRGHRFLSDGEIEIKDPARYAEILFKKGKVLVDDADDHLSEAISKKVHEMAEKEKGYVEHTERSSLVKEVAALVEWPVPMVGSFDEKYLALPNEVIVSVLEQHQRYFPLRDESSELMPRFIFISNIESKDPERVRSGNERVIAPRLADAMFFWETDRRIKLEHRCALLKDVLFQKKLGSLQDKTDRMAVIAAAVARIVGAKPHLAERAALLAKADLTTEMVGEFPELQGVMGRYYALNDGEEPEVAAALEDQYKPRFSGDTLPESDSGAALALADKLDTIVGMFAIGQPPTGDRDPFAVRRSALGVLRIIIEAQHDVDLMDLIKVAGDALPVACTQETREQVFDYMMDRLRGYYVERGTRGDIFDAVLAMRPTRPLDFENRIQAVEHFLSLDVAEDLAAANKRIVNILRKSEQEAASGVDVSLLKDPAELRLNGMVDRLEHMAVPNFASGMYAIGLEALADLKAPVDGFFEDVMVMVDDDAVRANRLALLVRTRDLLRHVADLSRLQA